MMAPKGGGEGDIRPVSDRISVSETNFQDDKTHTWSEVVYDGMEVYRRLVILDSSGVSAESVYVE